MFSKTIASPYPASISLLFRLPTMMVLTTNSKFYSKFIKIQGIVDFKVVLMICASDSSSSSLNND